ncbi:MAG: hypothetical protein FD187_3173, partial [bacterium]
YVLSTSGEMELEKAVGDHDHTVACKVVEGIAHGKGVAHGTVGRSGGRGWRDSFGEVEERGEGVCYPEAIGHSMQGAARGRGHGGGRGHLTGRGRGYVHWLGGAAGQGGRCLRLGTASRWEGHSHKEWLSDRRGHQGGGRSGLRQGRRVARLARTRAVRGWQRHTRRGTAERRRDAGAGDHRGGRGQRNEGSRANGMLGGATIGVPGWVNAGVDRGSVAAGPVGARSATRGTASTATRAGALARGGRTRCREVRGVMGTLNGRVAIGPAAAAVGRVLRSRGMRGQVHETG